MKDCLPETSPNTAYKAHFVRANFGLAKTSYMLGTLADTAHVEKMVWMIKWFRDIYNRQIRLTGERQEHIETDHLEMSGQIDKIQETLLSPGIIVRSRTDPDVELFYRHYHITPVTEKYLWG